MGTVASRLEARITDALAVVGYGAATSALYERGTATQTIGRHLTWAPRHPQTAARAEPPGTSLRRLAGHAVHANATTR